MKIFISSPGDVKTERRIAHRILRKLAAQYEIFEPFDIFLSELHPSQSVPIPIQQQLPRPEGYDLFVCIVWSRMGTPLPDRIETDSGGIEIVGPHGEKGMTGTEFEFAWALEGWKKENHPMLMVYRRKPPGADVPHSAADHKRLGEELDRVEAFEQQFKSENGTYISARHSFLNDVEFEELFEVHARKLIKDRLIDKGHDSDAVDNAKPPAVWKDRCPFRGLGRFEFEHAPIFFGRDRVTQEVIRRLEQRYDAGCGFLLLVGGSGAGKSSLVRAGVIPSLVKRAIDGTDAPVLDWRVAIASLDEQGGPAMVVARSLLQLAAEAIPDELVRPHALPAARTGPMVDSFQLARKIVDDPGFAACEVGAQLNSLSDVLRADKRNPSNAEARLLLFVDQFEQLFDDQIPQQRSQIIHFLKSLATNGQVQVVVAMRSDYYGKFQEHETLMQIRGDDGHFDVSPPRPSDVDRILRDAATAAGLTFASESADRDLADMLIEETQSQPNSLPLLSMCLERLYLEDCLNPDDLAKGVSLDTVHHRKSSELTLATYRRLGGIKGAVSTVAAALERELSEQELAAHKTVFWELVQLSDASDRPRSRVTPLATLQDDEARQSFVRRCVAHRLLTVYDQSDGAATWPVVGLTHESLFESWSLLKSWLVDYRQLLPIRARIEQSQARWETAKDTSLLLPPGLPLEEGRQLLLDAPNLQSGMGATIVNYIRVSITHDETQTRQRHRRRLFVSLALSILTILAVTGGALAWVKQREAETQAFIAKGNARDARLQRDDAKAARKAAEASAKVAKQQQLAAETSAQAAAEQSDLALSTLTSVIFDLARSLETLPGSAEVRNRLMTTVLPQLDKISTQFAKKSAIDRNTMAALTQLADTILVLGQSSPGASLDKQNLADALSRFPRVGTSRNLVAGEEMSAAITAERLYQRAHRIAQELAAAAPDDSTRTVDLLLSYSRLGDVFLKLGRTDNALRQFEDGLNISRELIAADPLDSQKQQYLSMLFNRLGEVSVQQGRTDDALRWYEDEVKINRKLAEASPRDRTKQRYLFMTVINLGDTFLMMGRTDQARRQYEDGLEISRKLTLTDSLDIMSQQHLAIALNRVGQVFQRLSQTDDALRLFEESLRINQLLAEADPRNMEKRRALASSFDLLGHLFIKLGRADDSRRNFEQSETALRTLAEADPGNVQMSFMHVAALKNVAASLFYAGQTDDSLRMFEDVLNRSRLMAEADPGNSQKQRFLASSFNAIGEVVLSLGRTEDARSQFEQGLNINRMLNKADPRNAETERDLADSYEYLGRVSLALGKTEESVKYFTDELQIAERQMKDYPADSDAKRFTSVVHSLLGDALLKLGQTDDALRMFENGLRINRELADADSGDAEKQRDLSVSNYKLGGVYLSLGRTDEAITHFQELLKRSREAVEADPNNAQKQAVLSAAFERLAQISLTLGRTDDAIKFAQDKLTLCRSLANKDPDSSPKQHDLNSALCFLGDALMQSRRFDDAITLFQEALTIGRAQADADPENAVKQSILATNYERLGSVLSSLDRQKDALVPFEDELKISRMLVKSDPKNTEILSAHSMALKKVASTYSVLDRNEDAKRLCEEDLEVARTLVEANPSIVQSQRMLSVAHLLLGDVYRTLGRTEDAQVQFKESLRVNLELAGAEPQNMELQHDLALIYCELGEVDVRAGQYADAIKWFQEGCNVLDGMIPNQQDNRTSIEARQRIETRLQFCQSAPIIMGDWETLVKVDAQTLPDLLSVRATEFAKRGQITEVVQAAEKLREFKATGPLYDAACACSLCAKLVIKGKPQPTEAEETQRKKLIDLSLECLKEAVAGGYDNFEHMRQHSDLQPLRDIPEFKALFPTSPAP